MGVLRTSKSKYLMSKSNCLSIRQTWHTPEQTRFELFDAFCVQGALKCCFGCECPGLHDVCPSFLQGQPLSPEQLSCTRFTGGLAQIRPVFRAMRVQGMGALPFFSAVRTFGGRHFSCVPSSSLDGLTLQDSAWAGLKRSVTVWSLGNCELPTASPCNLKVGTSL